MANKPKLVVLRRRTDFLELAQKGRKVQIQRWLVLNYRTNDLGQVRCGWTIPKQVGKAVLRNRLRRWCRETVRSKISELPSVDINVFLRPMPRDFYYNMLFTDFSGALHEALNQIRTRN